MSGGLLSLGGISKKRYNSSHSSLDWNQGERVGRLSVKKQDRTLGIFLKTGLVQSDCVRVRHISYFRQFCVKEHSTATPLHVPLQGQPSSGPRRHDQPLGQSNLCFPPCPNDAEGASEDWTGEDLSNPDIPKMALCPVVAPAGGDVGAAPLASSPLQGGTGEELNRPTPTLPGAPGGCPPEVPGFQPGGVALDEDDVKFLSLHLASGTAKNYKGAFERFATFCAKFNVSPYCCSPVIIAKYVRFLFDEGLEYSTINLHRSAISKAHVGFDGQPIGSHPLVRKALRSVFRQRPPLPKYTHTFDIQPVLTSLSSENAMLSLKQLTMKALVLTIYSTFSRVSSLARLGPKVTEHVDHIILHLLYLEKQGRPGHVRGFIQIPKFEDPSLCPARTLLYYVNKASSYWISYVFYLLFCRFLVYVWMISPCL